MALCLALMLIFPFGGATPGLAQAQQEEKPATSQTNLKATPVYKIPDEQARAKGDVPYVVYEQHVPNPIHASTSVNRADAATTLSFQMSVPAAYQGDITSYVQEVSATGRSYYDTNQYFYNQWSPNFTQEITPDGQLKLTITDYFDWQNTNQYELWLSARDCLYRVKVTADDAGKVVPVSKDSTAVPLEINVPFASGPMNHTTIGLHMVDENNVPFWAGVVYSSGGYVPPGTYNVQFVGEDGQHGYNLLMSQQSITSASHMLQVSRNDVSVVQSTVPQGSILQANSGYPHLPNFGMRSYYSYYGSEGMYVMKGNYDWFATMCTTSDGWNYSYYTPAREITTDATIAFDDQLSVQYNLNNTHFNAGRDYWMDGQVGVKDRLQNRVTWISGPDRKSANSSFTLQNSTQTFTLPNHGSVGYPSLTMPSTAGAYSMSFQVEGGPLAITTSTVDITIDQAPPAREHIVVANNPEGTPDTVVVNALNEGDVVRVYSCWQEATCVLGTSEPVAAGQSSATVTIPQLGTGSGQVYISVQPNGGMESGRTYQEYASEHSMVFFIKDPQPGLEVEEIWYSTKVTYGDGEGQYYYDRNPLNFTVHRTADGVQVETDGLDWAGHDTYTLLFSTSRYFFSMTLKQDQVQSQITWAPTADLIPLNVQIPYTTGTFRLQNLSLHLTDENGRVMVNAAATNPDVLIQPGVYNVNILGTDDRNGYVLYRKNVSLNAQNHVMRFETSEVSAVHLDMAADQKLNLQFADFFNWDGYDMMRSLQPGDRRDFYVSKLVYSELRFRFETDDGWGYQYEYRELDAAHDATLHFDTHLQAQINLRSPSYQPGQMVSTDELGLTVTDGAGNRINSVNAPMWMQPMGTLELIKGTDVVSYDIPVTGYAKIQLPSTAGQYEMTYRIPNSDLTIAPATAVINIGTINASAAPLAEQITITNHPDGQWDSVEVAGLMPGDVVNVYDAQIGGRWLGQSPEVPADSNVTTAEIWQLGRQAGTVFVSVTSPGKEESSRTAKGYAAEPKQLTYVSLDRASFNLSSGMTHQMAVTAHYSDGTTKAVTQEASFASAAASVASVDSNGVVTANGLGTTTISATYHNLVAQATVEVLAAENAVVKLSFDAGQYRVELDRFTPVRVTATYADGTQRDVTNEVNISCSIGEVSQGRMILNQTGSGTVSVSYKGQTATAKVMGVREIQPDRNPKKSARP